MKLVWNFQFDALVLMVLPSLAITALECEDEECAEVHGFGVSVGWLFWTGSIGIMTGD